MASGASAKGDRSTRLTFRDLVETPPRRKSAVLERGSRNPSLRTLVKLANAFRVSLRDLFDDAA